MSDERYLTMNEETDVNLEEFGKDNPSSSQNNSEGKFDKDPGNRDLIAAAYPQFASVTRRELSLRETRPVLAGGLARAGFCYTDESDMIRCFYCGLTLRNWEPGDCLNHTLGCPFSHKDYLSMGAERVSFDDLLQEMANSKTLPAPQTREMALCRNPAVLAVARSGFGMEDVVRVALEMKSRPLNSVALFEAVQKQQLSAPCPGGGGDPHGGKDNDIADATNVQEDVEKLHSENAKLSQQLLCKICTEEPRNVVFLPCGHLISCPDCSLKFEKCPECNKIIKTLFNVAMN